MMKKFKRNHFVGKQSDHRLLTPIKWRKTSIKDAK